MIGLKSECLPPKDRPCPRRHRREEFFVAGRQAGLFEGAGSAAPASDCRPRMALTLEEDLRWAVNQYFLGEWLLLLFDYDGTLAEFADTPEHALLPPATRVVLATLAAQPRVRVGIISGRELEE